MNYYVNINSLAILLGGIILQSYYDSQLDVARELFHKTQYDMALSILNHELPKIEAERNQKALCEYLNLKIACLLNKGDVTSVEPLLEKFKLALTASGNKELQVNHLYHSANLFYFSGDSERSIEYNLKSLEMLGDQHSHPLYVGICINLISRYLEKKDFEKADYYSKKISPLMSSIKHESPLTYFYYMNTCAYYLFEQERYDEAYEALNNVLTHPLLKDNTKQYAMTIINIGAYYTRTKQYEKADNYFKEGWTIIEKTSDINLKTNFLTAIINSYEEMGDYKNAYEFSRLKNDLLESEESRRQLERLHEFALRSSTDSLNMLAYTDKLTQLYNRHYFDEEAEKWLQEAIDHNSSLCCALFDIDNFKEINDQYGHIIGDQILRQIGEVLKKFDCENELFTSRYGGDEFIIFSKNVELFKQTIEHLVHTLQAVEIPYQDTYVTITVSLGAAVIEDLSDYTISMIVQKADEQLYEVKRSGKNNVKFA